METSKHTEDASERYALLGHNALSVTDGTDAEKTLYNQIETYFSRESALEAGLKDIRFRLFVLAASLRKRYLDPSTNEYDKAFRNWFFDRRNLQLRFGNLDNFSKYASAGELVNFIATESKTPNDDLAKLPSSITVLYQISLVRKDLFQRLKGAWIFWQLFVATPRRKSLTDTDTKPDRESLIHPHATEDDISNWWSAWQNPAPATSNTSRKLISIPVATIFVHKTLYDFDQRTGDHKGVVDLDDLTRLLKEVSASFNGRNSSKFRIETALDDIKERYEKKESRAASDSKIRDGITAKIRAKKK